jgi:hypothetical protein
MSTGKSDDDNSRHDLTRIEDLSEFSHEEDPELEDKFGSFNLPPDSTEDSLNDQIEGLDDDHLTILEESTLEDEIGFSLLNIDAISELNSDPEFSESDSEEVTQNFLSDSENDLTSETLPSVDDSPNDSLNFQSDDNSESLEAAPFEINFTDGDETPFALATETFEAGLVETQDENENENENEENTDTETEVQTKAPRPAHSQEKFEDVKNFANNFSYGKILGGGNPPFTIIIRNIKYVSDAEDIMILLREFEIITDKNTRETEEALALGSYIIPQISEYSAIILAHKLRRFDCDLEIGLSDEVRPSKKGELNPRGLLKKEGLYQNKSDHYKKSHDETPIKEIIVSTTSALEGYIIKKYIGVQTSFAIVDEEELQRLKFVQKAIKSNLELKNYDTEESVSNERAFSDYQYSFELLFTDLCDQLKGRAIKEKANALLGLNYQLTSLPFEKSANNSSCYQLTCSATLAVVKELNNGK